MLKKIKNFHKGFIYFALFAQDDAFNRTACQRTMHAQPLSCRRPRTLEHLIHSFLSA